jgi:AraC-like DNA-binding protein
MGLRDINRGELNGILAEAIREMPPIEIGGLALTMHYCMYVEGPKHFHTPEHQHPTYELTVHLGGAPLDTSVGRNPHPLSEEREAVLLALPPSLLHSRTQVVDAMSQILSFSFRLQGRDAQARRLCRRINARLGELGYEVPLTPLQREAVERLVAPPPPSRFRNELLRSAVKCFVMEFLATSFAHVAQDPEIPDNELENSVRNSVFISLNRRPLTLATLSQAYSLSPRQLTRRFKAKFGMTIGHWQRQTRLENARELLESTEDTVTDIAYTTGFPSLQAFTRFFHACEGCSPSEFRARKRKP